MQRKILDGASDPSPEINLVPLIDVCLVLVVILLMATPLAFEAAISVRQASTSARKAERPLAEERVEVRILDETTVDVNRLPVARENLTGTLRPLLDATSLRKVVVRAEPAVTHGTFVDVLDQAKQAGAADIAVVGS